MGWKKTFKKKKIGEAERNRKGLRIRIKLGLKKENITNKKVFIHNKHF